MQRQLRYRHNKTGVLSWCIVLGCTCYYLLYFERFRSWLSDLPLSNFYSLRNYTEILYSIFILNWIRIIQFTMVKLAVLGLNIGLKPSFMVTKFPQKRQSKRIKNLSNLEFMPARLEYKPLFASIFFSRILYHSSVPKRTISEKITQWRLLKPSNFLTT